MDFTKSSNFSTSIVSLGYTENSIIMNNSIFKTLQRYKVEKRILNQRATKLLFYSMKVQLDNRVMTYGS